MLDDEPALAAPSPPPTASSPRYLPTSTLPSCTTIGFRWSFDYQPDWQKKKAKAKHSNRRQRHQLPLRSIMDHRPMAWGRVSLPSLSFAKLSNLDGNTDDLVFSPATMSTVPTITLTCSQTAAPTSTPSNPW